MSRLQELHPDQQAVLQLVLRRRMPYDDLAGLLGLTPEGVRERALDAIDGLAPDDVEGLALEDRDRIADHLLGQDTGAERAATAALITEHAPAGVWAALVATELAPLGGPVLDDAPLDAGAAVEPPAPDTADAALAATAAGVDPAPGSVPGEPAPADAAPAGGPPPYVAPETGRIPHGGAQAAASSTADPGPIRAGAKNPLAGRSPKALAGGGVAALVVLLLIVWVAGGFGGGSDEDSDSEASTPPPAATTTGAAAASAAPTAEERAAAAQFVAALPQTIRFRPPSSVPSGFANVSGTARPAVSSQNAAFPVLALTIEGLPPLTETRRYFAWADKNGADPVFLGQLTEPTGAELPFQGLDLRTREATVVDPTVYSRVRITLEGNEAPTRPGRTIIVGTITPRS